MRLRNQMTPGLKKCKDGYKSPMKKASTMLVKGAGAANTTADEITPYASPNKKKSSPLTDKYNKVADPGEHNFLASGAGKAVENVGGMKEGGTEDLLLATADQGFGMYNAAQDSYSVEEWDQKQKQQAQEGHSRVRKNTTHQNIA